MGVTFTTRLPQWVADRDKRADAAVLMMATDIDRVAKMRAPHETGKLRNSGRITKNGNASYSVSFGDSQVRYARRRHYENKRNPGTLLYLEKAGDQVTRNPKRYLRGL